MMSLCTPHLYYELLCEFGRQFFLFRKSLGPFLQPYVQPHGVKKLAPLAFQQLPPQFGGLLIQRQPLQPVAGDGIPLRLQRLDLNRQSVQLPGQRRLLGVDTQLHSLQLLRPGGGAVGGFMGDGHLRRNQPVQ